MLRKHQIQLELICKRISAGEVIKHILVHVTPGGGKSYLPIIASKELIPHFAAALCWIVPRANLTKQAEKNFVETGLFLGHAHQIRVSVNDYDPCRELSGFVTTYQAVSHGSRILAQELMRKRYILVLDEPHHLAEDEPWYASIRPLLDHSVLNILMSGTLERHDRKPIGFLPYQEITQNELQIESPPPRYWEYIKYSRRDALTEKAICPLEFSVSDGMTEWIDKSGNHQSADSFSDAGSDISAAIFTALQTEYAIELLAKCAKDWSDYRLKRPSSQMLVIAPSIKLAKKYKDWLRKESGIRCRVGIATSDESEIAQKNIKKFTDRERPTLDVLVTVQIAYEGLDAPNISHLACLTQIRSKPWLEQCFARANRQAAGKDKGYIYGPDDPLFMEVMQKILEEQEATALIREKRDGDGDGKEPSDYGNIPVKSQVTSTRLTDLTTGAIIEADRTAAILQAMEKNGIIGVSPLQMLQFMEDVKAFEVRTRPALLSTPSERESILRASIARHVNKYVIENGLGFEDVNADIKRRFRKSRDLMTIKELQEVWAHVQRVYPLEGLRL
jgi:superfamily II DNA or RNA helicase